jgi:hypothetical protein
MRFPKRILARAASLVPGRQSHRRFEDLTQDLRYALRMLAKSPGFATVAILTTALGIGATTAIFSVVDATLLHPLPHPHPEELVRVEDNLQGVGAQIWPILSHFA